MKAIRLLFLFFFIFLSVNLYSSPYDMIPVGDPILEDIHYLSLESGLPFLSFTPPLSPHEINIFLSSIDVSSLSLPAQEAYKRIENRLNPQYNLKTSGENLKLAVNIASSLEARANLNEDISWLDQNPKIPSFLALHSRIYFLDILQLYFEPMIAMDPEYYSNQKYFAHNVPYDLQNIDQNLPLRAYLAFGNSWFNFQLGRDRLSYGTGRLGNLALSDNPSFYEFARLSFFSDIFKYSILVNQMPLDINGIYDTSGMTENGLQHTTQRYFYLHRFDISIFKKLTVSLTEGVIAGNSALEIRYLNPMMIFHSLYSFWNYPKWDGGTNSPPGAGDMNGSLLSLEINFNIIQSLTLYGQFVMNQLSTSYKEDQWGDPPPNGTGFLIGTRFSRSLGEWGSVFNLEFIYTDPYLYLNPSPFASLIHMRYLGVSPGRYQYSYIGYQRDTIALSLEANFFNKDILVLTGGFTWLSTGEHTINWDWEKTSQAYNEKTPSGTAENRFLASLGVKWKINAFITCKYVITGIYSINNAHIKDSNIFGGQMSAIISFFY